MNKDNALGAPTEGLGQTVTFGANLPGATQSQAPGIVPIRDGVVGGPRGAGFVAAQGSDTQVRLGPADPTMTFLMKAGEAVLAKELQGQKQAAYVSGMQRARAGAAIGEIVSEQPWYTQIFGDSDVVAGARAYTQQTKAQESILALQTRMPELRTMPLEQAGSEFNKAVTAAMTGDAETDAGLMQSFSRALPTIMSAQAREHYKYLQETASEERSKTWGSGAKAAQVFLSEAAVNKAAPEEMAADARMYTDNLAMPVGANKESYHRDLAGHLISAAEGGQFHAIKAAAAAGYIDQLPEQFKAQVMRSWETNERALVTSPAADAYVDRLTALARVARTPELGMTPEDLVLAYEDLNADWSNKTGSRRGLVPVTSIKTQATTLSDQIESMNRALLRARVKEAATVGKEQGEAAAAQERQSTLIEAIKRGNTSYLTVGEGAFKSHEIETAVANYFVPTLQRTGNPPPGFMDQFTSAMAVGTGDGVVKRLFAQQAQEGLVGMQAGNIGPFTRVYENYLRIKESPGGDVVLPKLFDANTLRQLNSFNAIHPERIDAGNPAVSQAAYAGTFGNPMKATDFKDPTKEEVGAIVTELKGKLKEGWLPAFLGTSQITDPQAAALTEQIGGRVTFWQGTGMPRDRAVQQALGSWQQSGGIWAGGYAWVDPKHKGKTLYDRMAAEAPEALVGTDEAHSRFEAYVKSEAEKVGGTPTMIVPTANGFGIFGMTRDGSPMFIPATFKDAALHKPAAAQVKLDAAKERLQAPPRRGTIRMNNPYN